MWEWEKSLVMFHFMEGELLAWDLCARSCLSQLLTLRDMDMCLLEKNPFSWKFHLSEET